jgi:DNA-directed RNA polymerase alpha subunit
MKINVDFNSLAELLNFSKTLANGLVPAEQELKADKNLPIGASNWQQAYEHTMANLRRAYERIRVFEDLKKTNPVIRAEFEKINSKLKAQADKEQSALQKDLLTNLTFSNRVINALRSEGILTITSLLKRTEEDLMKLHNFGALSLKDVKETLKANNLKLKGKK